MSLYNCFGFFKQSQLLVDGADTIVCLQIQFSMARIMPHVAELADFDEFLLSLRMIKI